MKTTLILILAVALGVAVACDWSYFSSENQCQTTFCGSGCPTHVDQGFTNYYCLYQGNYCCMCVEVNYHCNGQNCNPVYHSTRTRVSYASEACERYGTGNKCPSYEPVGGGGQ